MAAPTAWSLTNGARDRMLSVDLESGTYKMALFISTSNLAAGSTTYAGVTNEVSNANGYTTGGVSVTFSASGTTTITMTIGSAVWTASASGITARFAAIYEVAGNVFCFCTLDSAPADVVVAAGNTLTISEGGSGVFTLT